MVEAGRVKCHSSTEAKAEEVTGSVQIIKEGFGEGEVTQLDVNDGAGVGCAIPIGE